MRGQQTRSGRGFFPTPPSSQPQQTQGQGATAARPFITGKRVVAAVLVLVFGFGCFQCGGCPFMTNKAEPGAGKGKAGNGQPVAGTESPDTEKKESEGTFIGGTRVVVDISPDRVNDWMLEHMANREYGWKLMRRQWSGSIDRCGYLPIPVGPLLPGAEVTITPHIVRRRAYEFDLRFVNQNRDRQAAVLFRESWTGENVVSRNTVSLFLVVLPNRLIASSLEGVMGQKPSNSGMYAYNFSVTVSKLPENAGLWVGSYSFCQANLRQTPGEVPFKVDGKEVSWTMRLTFIPWEPVAPGAYELKETISPPGLYEIYPPRLWLLPPTAQLDRATPAALKTSLDAACVYQRDFRPPFNERESPTRDSFTVSSEEVRRSWRQRPDRRVDQAVVSFQSAMPALVYWEMFFPVATTGKN